MTRLLARYTLVVFVLCALSVPARAFTLLVRTSPDGATVTIEGKTLPSPATFDLKRRDEPYVVAVQKAGYQSETYNYLYYPQKLKEISITLEPLSTQRDVTIKSIPEGATSTIDGK